MKKTVALLKLLLINFCTNAFLIFFYYYETQFFENIRYMINMLNLNAGINSKLENEEKFDDILEKIDMLKRVLK